MLIMPGGLYYGSFALIASPAMLNKLSAADRKAVMSVSGAKLSQFAGVQWDAGDKAGRAAAEAAGTKIQTASAAVKEQYLSIMKPVEEVWIERPARADTTPRAALAELRQIARAYDKAK